MEIWDVLDENGNKTGKVIEKTHQLPKGQYHLGVDVWIKNRKGEYLIQKRAPTKKRMPGKWMTTGGSALHNENGVDAAIRETFEELGIKVDASKLVFLFRYRFNDCINEVWLLQQDIEENSIKLQSSEVSDVKWATENEIIHLIDNQEMIDYGKNYLADVFSERKHCTIQDFE